MSPCCAHRKDLFSPFSGTGLRVCHYVTLSTEDIPHWPLSASPGNGLCLKSSSILPATALHLQPQMSEEESSLCCLVVGNPCSAPFCYSFWTLFPASSSYCNCGHFHHLLSRLPPSCRRTSSLFHLTSSIPLFSVAPFLTSMLSSGFENLMVSLTHPQHNPVGRVLKIRIPIPLWTS